MNPIYHYTVGTKLPLILEAEEIIPAFEGVNSPEIPAVWLSTNEKWEHTATKGIIKGGVRKVATLSEMVDGSGFLVRIEIDPKMVKMIYAINLRKSLRITKDTFAHLISSAKDVGANPNEWRAVVNAIPSSAFLRVEVARETDPIVWVDAESALVDSQGA